MKELKPEECYRIIKTNDARFDGEFFVAVKTTGIYCRTVCKVPSPKPENCEYFHTAAEAEEHGYRPCLRCRPELAPSFSEFNSGNILINQALECFEDYDYRKGTISKTAEYLGISTRHLQRIFNNNIGVSPKEYIRTKRLLRAKTLLTDTKLPIADVSFLSGFDSVSRFNASFKENYNLTPSDIRKDNKKSDDVIVCKLGFRPPYDWDLMLDFFSRRAIPGVESVKNKQYRRSLRLTDNNKIYTGWINIKPLPDENKVEITISQSLDKVLFKVLNLVKKAFDLDADPKQFPAAIDKGVRIPGCFDLFEMAVRAILGQQIAVKAASTLSGRLAESFGEKIITPWEGVGLIFPSAGDVLEINEIEKSFGGLGVIRARSRTIGALAEMVNKSEINISRMTDVADIRSKLMGVKGIGLWSAEYIIMRGYSYPDILLYTDLVIKRKLLPYLEDEGNNVLNELTCCSKYKLNKKYERAAIDFAEQFKPWCSYLSIALWNDRIQWELVNEE